MFDGDWGDWTERLAEELEQPYFKELVGRLEQEYRKETVYPPRDEMFRALELTPYDRVKVVILGQDPYHGAGEAHGLSFSVKPGVRVPPSLRNILRELHDDIGCALPDHGCLKRWAEQGVLLLNTVLTVRANEPGSHQGIGWERFTDRIIQLLNDREQPLVFILWGNHAQAKRKLIDAERHHVIASAHPSPLAARRGFFGSRPFSRANAFLRQHGMDEIDWSL